MPDLSEKSIFLQALDIESRADRRAFLLEACGEDISLRESVDELLRAHETADNPLDVPVAQWNPEDSGFLEDTLITDKAIAEDEGTIVDAYRLMEQIGEGGFGLVFVAEQRTPVRRQVALKILKPGMDTKEVVARFEAERQALAMMDHPNIAAVYDAGATKTGRPYFVMELVRGISITDFCDQQKLDMQARLQLFINVCKAVQHAHQKGIIHRDIKPSNVLVTSHDGIPVVKVIDFGVAKAIGQRLTEKTIYTRFTAMIGTPLYMSPEQAELSGLDIDTRSDIYSLGVLLYELLTGTTPFDSKRLNSATYDELRRIIREEEPPRPSDRLTTLGKIEPTVEVRRGKPSAMLPRLVRGDVDWIVMKAMEKDRTRRYESAGSLANDVQRYLSNDAIEARPPSQLYRLQKLARRHRVVLLTASLVTMSLVLGIGISLWQASKAMAERNDKEAARQEAVKLGNEATAAKKQIEEFAERLKQANILVTSGRAHAGADRLSAAFSDYTEAIDVQPNYYNAWLERASLQVQVGLWKPAASDFAEALKLGVPPDNPANWGIAQLFLYTGDEDNYRAYCNSMLKFRQQKSESPSIVEIRSYVMAPKPIVSAVELAVQAEELLGVALAEQAYRANRYRGPSDRGHRGSQSVRDERPEPSHHPRLEPMGHGAGDDGGRPFPFPDARFETSMRRRPSGPPVRNPSRAFRMHHPRGAVAYIVGLAHYRAEEFELAIQRFQEALDDRAWPARRIVHPVLAMAFHRSGQTKDARDAFLASENAVDEWTANMLNGPVGMMPLPWFDWIEVKLLHAEASVLLTGFTPVEDPRTRQIEARSLAAIRE